VNTNVLKLPASPISRTEVNIEAGGYSIILGAITIEEALGRITI
jgi:hypothetical protein